MPVAVNADTSVYLPDTKQYIVHNDIFKINEDYTTLPVGITSSISSCFYFLSTMADFCPLTKDVCPCDCRCLFACGVRTFRSHQTGLVIGRGGGNLQGIKRKSHVRSIECPVSFSSAAVGGRRYRYSNTSQNNFGLKNRGSK